MQRGVLPSTNTAAYTGEPTTPANGNAILCYR
jgi:hypothetical protein